MENNPFLKTVEKLDGFELTLGFREDEDHFLGGSENKVWYCVQKGRRMEYRIGTLSDGIWTDRYFIKKGKDLLVSEAESGSTMEMILNRAYFGQDFIQAEGRAPVHIVNSGLKLSHYVYRFGELAYDVSEDYGVTVSYSNLKDEKAGYRTRNIKTGKSVKPPKEK